MFGGFFGTVMRLTRYGDWTVGAFLGTYLPTGDGGVY